MSLQPVPVDLETTGLLDDYGHRAHADARRSLEEARQQRSALRALSGAAPF